MTASSFSGLGRSFYLLQLAALLNAVGARCGQLAIAWWVLDKTGDPLLFSAFVAIATFADVLSRALCGWLGDEYDRQRLLVGCYAVSTAVTLVLAGLGTLDLYQPLAIGICLAISGISIGIREPVQMSLVPGLVAAERITDAVRLRSLVGASSALIGPLAAGILLGPLGVLGTLWLNAVAVILALILTALVRSPVSPRNADGPRPRDLATWYWRTRAGFTALYRIKPEWHLSLLAFIVNFALYPWFAVLLPVLINRHYPKAAWLLAVTEGPLPLGCCWAACYWSSAPTDAGGGRWWSSRDSCCWVPACRAVDCSRIFRAAARVVRLPDAALVAHRWYGPGHGHGQYFHGAHAGHAGSLSKPHRCGHLVHFRHGHSLWCPGRWHILRPAGREHRHGIARLADHPGRHALPVQWGTGPGAGHE